MIKVLKLCLNLIIVLSMMHVGSIVDLHHASFNIYYFLTKEDDTWLWHNSLGHIHMQHFKRLNRK